MMKYVFMALVLLLLAGCATKEAVVADNPTEVAQDSQTESADVEGDLNALDSLSYDLNFSDLDNLDAELDDINFE